MILISGPCVIEDFRTTYSVASRLKEIADEVGFHLIFKSSYDKANRSKLDSFRGPGLEKGLDILVMIKQQLGIQITTDVHEVNQVERAALVVDVIQVPAFLCRQTDLLIEAGRAGKPVNIKKGQFMSPWQMEDAVEKVRSGGCQDVTVIERGTCFGYNNLVVDFRGVVSMRQKFPVIFDATHSVQLPGEGGQSEFVPYLASAAVAVGVDGVFMETHPEPNRALCDGANSIKLSEMRALLRKLKRIENGADI